MPSAEFLALMDKKLDAHVAFKVELVDEDDVAIDVTAYFKSGGGISQSRQRAPDEIEAGNFDVVFINTDDTFSEYLAASDFFGREYIGTWSVVISQGFVLADGTVELLPQSTGIIDELNADDKDSTVTIRCRDRISTLLDAKLRTSRTEQSVVADPDNGSDGTVSPIQTLAFKTVNEDWILTCTFQGGAGVGLFSVVGSVSGNVGTATVGTEFSTGTGPGGIRFTINAVTGSLILGDVFTFSTFQAPEWTLENPVKIIWSLLTGYDWDTDTAEDWADATLGYDHEQSDANVDLDYDSFVQAIADVGSAGFLVSGYIGVNAGASETIQGLLLLFFGSLFTGNDGRIRMSTFTPRFDLTLYRNFADTKKIIALGYSRSQQEIINRVTVTYKDTPDWSFSGDEEVVDGTLILDNVGSQTATGRVLGQSFTVPWFSPNGTHVEDLATRLLERYAIAPVNIEFETLMDALMTNIGDFISVTDEKYGLDGVQAEVMSVEKNFDEAPRSIRLVVRREGSSDSVGYTYGFLGSDADEGDGISPQAASYDSADAQDRLFAYLGTEADYEGPWSNPNSSTPLTINVGDEFGLEGYFGPTPPGAGVFGQLAVFTGSRLDNILFDTGFIQNFSGTSVYFMNTQEFHRYRMVIASSTDFDVYVDEVLIGTWAGTASGSAAAFAPQGFTLSPQSAFVSKLFRTVGGVYTETIYATPADPDGPDYRLF